MQTCVNLPRGGMRCVFLHPLLSHRVRVRRRRAGVAHRLRARRAVARGRHRSSATSGGAHATHMRAAALLARLLHDLIAGSRVEPRRAVVVPVLEARGVGVGVLVGGVWRGGGGGEARVELSIIHPTVAPAAFTRHTVSSLAHSIRSFICDCLIIEYPVHNTPMRDHVYKAEHAYITVETRVS